MIHSKIVFKKTKNNIKYYEEEALNFLPQLIENLISYRADNLMYDLEIPETSCCMDKFNNNEIYLEWYLKIIHKSYEDILYMNEDSIEHQMSDKAHLISFMFNSKDITEYILKILLENDYKVDINEEPLEIDEEGKSISTYKIIHIKWDN